MKRMNKYHWLTIGSIIVFALMALSHHKKEKEKAYAYNASSYSLEVIDNEIRYMGKALYRFIPVDGGEMDFTYISKLKQEDRIKNIKDTTELYNSVRVDIPSFLIGETPVTVNLWEIVMNDRIPSKGSAYEYEIHYVKDKTKEQWEDFLKKLSEKTGCDFSLPTSNQWEYAARGGRKSKNYKYSGSDVIDEVACYIGNTRSENLWTGRMKAPNELGLYDMSGGVRELTCTPYTETDGFVKMVLNDRQSKVGEGNISRGGDFKSNAEDCETRHMESGVHFATGARLILNY